MGCNQYTRRDHVIGVGFEIEYAGKRMHSIAWPDRPAERYMNDELESELCKVSPMGGGCCKPCDTPLAVETPAVEPVAEVAEPAEPTADAPPESVDPLPEVIETQTPVDPIAPPEFVFNRELTETVNIYNYLTVYPNATNQEVIAALNGFGMEVSTSQVSRQRTKLKEVQGDTSETTV